MDAIQLASFLDHTLLKPEATQEQIEALCAEAKRYGFASVCVLPYWVKHCADLLSDSKVKVCTVVGFPLGAHALKTKVTETREALKAGAQEIDMVINLGAFKSGHLQHVEEEIKAVVAEAADHALVKVIIETGLLTKDEKATICQMILDSGAHFVKTSTGFSAPGATVEDVRLIRSIVQGRLGIKASGGIRTYDQAMAMIKAGATRLGSSSSLAIVGSAP